MGNKVKWANTKLLTIEECSTLKLDQERDYYVGACCIKKITKKFHYKQKKRALKFIATLYHLFKMKHPRFMQKATRKNLTRRKYGTK